MLPRGSLLFDQRLEMLTLLDLGAAIVTAAMVSEHLRAVDNTQIVRVGEHRQCPTHMRVGHGIIVQVEADIRGLADLDRDALEQWNGVVGQPQQMSRLLGEHRTHCAVRFARTPPICGQPATPIIRLSIEVVEIGEAAGSKECRTYVAYGSFHAALFVAARDRDGTGFVVVVTGKIQQRRMEADGIAAPFQHRTLQIVVEQHAWHAAPGGKGADMAAQKVLHPGVEVEPEKNLPRVAEHHDERHQRTAAATDLQVAKMAPVHLRLFAGQAAQAQIRLRRTAWAMLGDKMAEVIRTAAIAALVRHREQAAGGQCREFLQRLADQRQIGVDRRRPLRRADPGQTGLRQHAPHHAVVDMQLPGDGADRPLLGVIVAQDLRFDVRRHHHGVRAPSGHVEHGRDGAGGDAGTRDAAMAGSHDHTNGSVAQAAEARQRGEHHHARPSSRPAATDHPLEG